MSDASYYLVPDAAPYYPAPQHGLGDCWPSYGNVYETTPPWQPTPYDFQPPVIPQPESNTHSPTSLSPPHAASRPYTMELNVPKKKARAMQACDHCRFRKQRCDEGLPCSYCKENSLACNYRPIVPTKLEKVVETMIEWMAKQSENLSALSRKIDTFDASLRTQEWRRNITQPAARNPTPTPAPRDNSHLHRPSHRSTPLSGLCTVVSWPEAHNMITEAGSALDASYLVAAEDRPVLKLREDQAAGRTQSPPRNQAKVASVSSDVDDHLSHSHLPSAKRKRSAAEDSGLPGIIAGGGFDIAKITSLHAAFFRKIHPIVPIIDSKELQRSVKGFIQRYVPSAQVLSIPPSKRLCLGISTGRISPQTRPQCDPDTAIALLVFALGAATIQNPRPSESADEATPSSSKALQDQDRQQDIPGTTYFQEAVNIVAAHMDGNELFHAQMFLLAGIYKAQLARMNEASSWYSMAGRVLSHLVHRRGILDANDRSLQGQSESSDLSEDEMILKTAWTCIQLETEITPDLRLPQSGLSAVAPRLPVLYVPSLSRRGSSQSESQSGAEVSIQPLIQEARVRLSRLRQNIQQSLSGLDSGSWLLEQSCVPLKQCIADLQHWRSSLALEVQWYDEDAPPVSLLHVRLRHLYWETKINLLRPFLDYTLHILPLIQEGASFDTCLTAEARSQRSSTDVAALTAVHHMFEEEGESEVLRNAWLCIAAAKQSIVAFDGVEGCLVLPDLLSVLHGQFCNVLLLAIGHRCEQLRDPVPFEELLRLMQSSSDALKEFARTSPAGRADWAILKAVHLKLKMERR